jgi:F0F1-type ATP synthase assembly protein I
VLPRKGEDDLFELKNKYGNSDKEKRSTHMDSAHYIRLTGLGMTIPFAFLAGPLLGYFVGTWLDGRYGTGWITGVAVVLGLVGSIRLVISLVQQLQK